MDGYIKTSCNYFMRQCKPGQRTNVSNILTATMYSSCVSRTLGRPAFHSWEISEIQSFRLLFLIVSNIQTLGGGNLASIFTYLLCRYSSLDRTQMRACNPSSRHSRFEINYRVVQRQAPQNRIRQAVGSHTSEANLALR